MQSWQFWQYWHMAVWVGGLAFLNSCKRKSVHETGGVFHREPFFSGCYIDVHFKAISKGNDKTPSSLRKKLISTDSKGFYLIGNPFSSLHSSHHFRWCCSTVKWYLLTFLFWVKAHENIKAWTSHQVSLWINIQISSMPIADFHNHERAEILSRCQINFSYIWTSQLLEKGKLCQKPHALN